MDIIYSRPKKLGRWVGQCIGHPIVSTWKAGCQRSFKAQGWKDVFIIVLKIQICQCRYVLILIGVETDPSWERDYSIETPFNACMCIIIKWIQSTLQNTINLTHAFTYRSSVYSMCVTCGVYYIIMYVWAVYL